MRAASLEVTRRSCKMPCWLLKLVAEGKADRLEMAVFKSYVYGDLEAPPPWLVQQAAAIPRMVGRRHGMLAGSRDN